jgi:hypothetical protein
MPNIAQAPNIAITAKILNLVDVIIFVFIVYKYMEEESVYQIGKRFS